jgi:hypothetical protein
LTWPSSQKYRKSGLWSHNNAHLKPKAWLIGGKWRAVLGKEIVSERPFETKAEALIEAAKHGREDEIRSVEGA